MTEKLNEQKQRLIAMQKPVYVDQSKLPDYMTYRHNKLKEKKNMKIAYTYEITKNLPK